MHYVLIKLQIGVIFQYAPKLKFLNIGYNKFSLVEIQSPVNFPVADTIKTLILIGTEASWEAVWFLLSHTRNCTELHLSRNGYTHVALSCIESSTTESGELGLIKVEKLMFDSNPITSWEEIAKLGNKREKHFNRIFLTFIISVFFLWFFL